MANLQALKEKVKNIQDYSPAAAKYNEQLDELLNDAYYYIWSLKRWAFGSKEYNFKFHPDMIPARENPGGLDINASVVKGSRLVNFSGPMDRLTPNLWEGQPIQIQNYEYIISKVVSSSQSLVQQVFLRDTHVDDVAWRRKQRWCSLREDCLELVS